MNKEKILLLKLAKSVRSNKKILNDVKLDDIDWFKLYDLLNYHKIFQFAYSRIKDSIPIEYKEKYNIRHKELISKTNDYIQEAKRIHQLAMNNNISILFIKGFILSKMLYENIYIREFNDIDILLKKEDLNKMKILMNEIGFWNTYFTDDSFIRIKEPSTNKRGVFHEFLFSKIGDKNNVWVELKCYTSAIKEKYISIFLKNRECIKIENSNFQTNSILYTFLHLCSNVYGNSERRFNIRDHVRLRDYIDIYLFVNKYNKYINWEHAVSISNKLEILHKVFCVLNNTNIIYPNFLSIDIIEKFNPQNVIYKYTGNSKGEIVEWRSNFIDRLMNMEERFEEYEYLYYLRSQSNDNLFYNDTIYVKEFTNQEIYNFDQFKIMKCLNDIDFGFNYSFFKGLNVFSIIIKFNKYSYEYFKNTIIDFNFFYDPLQCSDYVKIIRIYNKCDKVMYEYNNIINTINDEEIIEKSDVIILKIDVDLDYISNGWELKKKLAYNIYAFENIIKDAKPILIGVMFSDDDDPEESPNLGTIEILK